MKKRKHLFIKLFLVFILACVVYIIYDNQRFTIITQEIPIAGLPDAFEDYAILQISDLHGKYFGDNQQELIHAIRNLDFDCILLTGDMNKYKESDVQSSGAVLDLINGIQDMAPIFWVDGNGGPYAIETIDGGVTGRLTDFGQLLESMGVQVLTEPAEIQKDSQRIWLTPELSKMELQMNYEESSNDAVVDYGKKLQTWIDRLDGNGEVKIRVSHYPLQGNLTTEDWDNMGYIDYALSIAGHYHGGQIRLPFYGALYIPCPTAGIGGGFFPDQKEVKGLTMINGMPQYVSAGLGASVSKPLLGFRAFNTPEVNLLVLKQAS